MVSAAGKNIPVLVSPVVVIAGKLTVPAGNTNGSVEDKVAPLGMVMVSPLAPKVREVPDCGSIASTSILLIIYLLFIYALIFMHLFQFLVIS
jgi:hypothetical protein